MRSAVVFLAFIALASACGERATRPAGQVKPGSDTSAPTPAGTGGRATNAAPASTPTGAVPSGQSASAPSPSPFRTPFPADPAVRVDGKLTPVCAHNGTQMTLVVETNPKSAVGYQAIYSDNHGGGEAPYGSGYGGNDKGISDDKGHFRSTWVISPSAPKGVARVDVVVAWQGKWGYQSLTFHVGPDGTCT